MRGQKELFLFHPPPQPRILSSSGVTSLSLSCCWSNICLHSGLHTCKCRDSLLCCASLICCNAASAVMLAPPSLSVQRTLLLDFPSPELSKTMFIFLHVKKAKVPCVTHISIRGPLSDFHLPRSPKEQTEMGHTHWEVKHIWFTRVRSAGEITAHTEKPMGGVHPRHSQIPKQKKAFGKFS